MAYFHYDRLTALDSMFLDLETEAVHMHVGAVATYDARPVRTTAGALDIERIFAHADKALRKTPRFRQKLSHVPLFNRPVWVDDDRFNLLYHLRHTSLPRPGDIRQLKRLAGRIMSQKLDRGKPLWEMWFVDGVEGDQFAVISKVHHCMIDGISGVDVISAIMAAEPHAGLPPAKPWVARPAPAARDLLRGELTRRAVLPLALLKGGQELLQRPSETVESVVDTLRGLGEAARLAINPASPTPLNTEIGPHRRFDWVRLDIDAIDGIRQRVGGTINDVVLATVAGAARRFLRERGVNVNKLDFRAMVPVNLRGDAERGALGNRISFLMAQLPVDERDPYKRYKRVMDTTHRMKRSSQIRGGEALEELSDLTFSQLMVQYAKLSTRNRFANIVVTNVPGPRTPVYLLEARMREIYPVVPLFENQAVGVALFSYDGGLHWGFNSDWDAVPDLHDLVDATAAEFGLLRKMAAEAPVEIGRGAARTTGRRTRPSAA